MIKYHGTPITPMSVFKDAVSDKNVLISFAHSGDLNRALKYCNKICLDNGAFSFWTKGKTPNWSNYYKWVEENYERIEFFIIPDVIDGTEEENDEFLRECYYKYTHLKNKAIPVWHIAESFDRLERLTNSYEYIAIGSSGEYSELGTEQWHKRMNDVMKITCDENGIPKVKIHMLRCLDAKIFTKYPFYSGDSTNLARNHARDGWRQILSRIEPYFSPDNYKFKKYYETNSLFAS